MVTLSSFLEATSIHGLRYIRGAEHPLCRLAWAICVAGSVAAAAVITFLNVVAWDNQPSVVTKVQLAHLGELDVPVPTVTVCPQRPDFGSLLVGYFTEHYDPGDSPELDVAAKTAVIRQRLWIRENEARKVPYYTREDAFKSCVNVTDSEPCDFVRVVNAMAEQEAFFCMDVKARDFAADYIIGAVMNGTEASLGGLERAYTDRCVRHGIKHEYRTLPATRYKARTLYEIYSLFHRPNVNATSVRGLKEFDQVKGELDPDLGDLGEMGGLIAKALAVSMFQPPSQLFSSIAGEDKEFRDAVLSHFFDKLSGELGGDVEGADDVLELLSYNAADASVAARANAWKFDHPVQSGKMTMRELLMDSCDEYPEECRRYHNATSAANTEKSQDLIAELFRLSVGHHGSLEKTDASRSLLPGCSWDKIDGICWDRIVIDRGLCFTSYYRDYGVLYNGSNGNDYLIDFTLFSQGMSIEDFTSKWAPEYDGAGIDVLIAPRGHFLPGKLAAEEDVAVEIKADAHSPKFADTGLHYVSVVRTTAEFRALAPDKRECLFPDERELRFFPEYSEPTCMLECAWDRARESCGCVPWFLREHYPETPMCEIMGNDCFKKIVDNRYGDPPEGCSKARCPGDCETAEFTLDTEERTVNSHDLCGDSDDAKAADEKREMICGHYEEKFSFLGKGSDWWEGEKRSLVYHRVRARRKAALGILLTATVSAIDMISNVGGTLGLFTGFSILSGVEVLYWAAKGSAAKNNGKYKKHSGKK